jgi:VanZ family protein
VNAERQRQRSARHRALVALFYYGPLVFWALLIGTLSTGAGSRENSLGILVRTLQQLAPDLISSFSAENLGQLDYALRKSAHFAQYLILTLLAVRALQFGRCRLRWQSVAAGLAGSVLYAALDEANQTLHPSRSPSVHDVLLDAAGSATAAFLIALWAGVKALERRLREAAQLP